jgi:hypothetical protein
MSKKHKDSEANNSTNDPIPPVNSGDENAGHDVKEANHGHQSADNPKHKPAIYKMVIAFFRKADNQPKVANLISAGMLVATIVLAIFTYKVFNQTTSQTIAANRSADAAKISADAAKRSADLQKKALDESSDFNKRIFKLQQDANNSSDSTNKSTLAQTKAYNEKLLTAQKEVLTETKKDAIKKDYRDSANLAETKKEFEIENSPFLEIVNASISTVEKNKPVIITFAYFNHSKLPAQVIVAKSRITYSMFKNAVASADTNNFAQTKGKSYIANGVSENITTQTDSLMHDIVSGYNSGVYYLFLEGYCEYVNPVTKKKFKFSFTQRFTEKPVHGAESTRADVDELK